MKPRTIRTLRDFLDVPSSELNACLRAFRETIERAKFDAACVAKLRGSSETMVFDEFIWEGRESPAAQLGPMKSTTPIEELELRPTTRFQLKEQRIYCLEDLSEISESELMRMPDVGKSTVNHLREMLGQIGMTFKTNPNRVGALAEMNRAAGKQRIDDRAGKVTNASHVAELGLASRTFTKLLQRGHETVESLRSLTVRDYALSFGPRQSREIITTLAALGLPLHTDPRPLELWEWGIIKKSELPVHADTNSPLAELSPWLGGRAVSALTRHGASCLQDVIDLVRAGAIRNVQGIGETSAREVVTFLKQRNFLGASDNANAK